MKSHRILEVLCVPLALAGLARVAAPLAMELIQLLGREYAVTDIMSIFRIVGTTIASGVMAGIVAVAVQRRKAAGRRWAFYGLLALSVPAGAAVVFAIEAVRPRFGGAFGFPESMPNIASVPFWILAAGFWAPFPLLLRDKRPGRATEPAPASPAHL